MKKLAVIYSKYSPTVDAIKYNLQQYQVDCFCEKIDNTSSYDLIVLVNCHDKNNTNTLRCHHSLLPAFDSDEPERDAILAGAKVSGITILQNNEIIAQYPVFITSDMHYEDLKQELNYLEQTIYPIVIGKVLNNEPFELKTLLGKNNCCQGGCLGCTH